MKKYISTILYFLIPFLLMALILIYIDPYNIIRREKNKDLLRLKEQISYRKNYALYKLQEYYYNPTDVIVLGDSRANHLYAQSFDSISGEQVTNLAYGGGTTQEIVETFWIISRMHKLKKVYIGINFNLYNALNVRTRVKTANNLRNSIPSYILSRYCIESSFLMIKALITNDNIDIEKPPYSKEKFWERQLNVSAPSFYKNYKYPSIYYNDLHKISEHCHINKIELVFFIPPTHIDLQNKIKEYHLEKDNEQFKKDLISLNVPVIDFNFENSMTKNKQNFGDPFHFNSTFEQIIINVISSSNDKVRTHNNVYKSLGK
jgi:hypothetical protein